MIRSLMLSLLLFVSFATVAQDAKQLHETARQFMAQGDYNNSILVLNRALKLDVNSLAIAKDLGLAYYYAHDYNKALEVNKPLLDREDADDQCFQIAGNIYLALENTKECEKAYKKGLKKVPNSGGLYNAYGELLWAQKDYTAIKQWEKGIEMDPSYSRNYYNASRYYYFTTDKVWSLIYGEIFLNIEPSGTSSPEIKNILFEGYKKLFADADLTKTNDGKNQFVTAFLQTMNKQSMIAAGGMNTETLVMIRSRFILDWFNGDFGSNFPLRLFDQQRLLMQEGLFDAYNHWIFTASQNLPAYQNWITANEADNNEFTRFQKGRIFKIPGGQYYHL